MTILFVIQIIVVVMMIGTILMQKTSSDGLMSGSNPDSFLTGRASANILSRTTAILAAIFIINSLVMGYLVSHSKRADSVVDEVFAGRTEQTPPADGTKTPETTEAQKEGESAPASTDATATPATDAAATDVPPAPAANEQKPATVPAAD